LGKNPGDEDTMRNTIDALLNGGDDEEIWDEKRFVKEEQRIRNLFLNDPEFMEFIARVRTLKAVV